ncbi:class I SAM-dependent methyltransferase [Sediminibacterium salmoneum]|uniref:class I SAM-dependent methyltransferase n=1 Tax=Sediminibacterium salmoneum TaxID=426421 RepID=UPI001FE18193|nr:class I SAM-dependent methyltransferase [Sediminibacterium salmoneum]
MLPRSMFTPVHLFHCPACNSDNIKFGLSAQDHTVSKQDFDIWYCHDCSLRFTQDIPAIHEIGAFYQSASYISHSNTKKGLINQLYHLVRNYTLGLKARQIKQFTGLSKGRLLDIGAGVGAFAATMKKTGWEVRALEPDENARKTAAETFGLSLSLPDELYQFSENSFDVITLWHVLEHVHDLPGYWKAFHTCLPKGGKLVIAVPNYTSADACHYQQDWAAYDVPRHLYHFSPASMQKLATQNGFSMVKMQPMWFDAFYVAMLSEQYKTGKINYLSAFIQGLKSNLAAIGNPAKCSSVIYVMEKI